MYSRAAEATDVVAGPHEPPSRRGPWSVRTYLVLVIVAALLAMLSASGYGFIWSAQKARSSAVPSMTFSANRAVSRISLAVKTAHSTVQGLGQQANVATVFVNANGCQLAASGDSAFAKLRVDIVAPDGRVACSSDPGLVAKPRPHAGSAWLATGLAASESTVSWDALDAVTDQPAIVVSAPIRSGGQAKGVVAVFLPVPGVGASVAEDLEGARGTSFTLVDRRDQSVLSSSEGPSGGTRFASSAANGEWVGPDGVEQVFGSADVPDSTWRVYAGVDRTIVLAQSHGALVREGLVGLFAILVLGAGMVVLARRVSRPLRQLTDAVTAATRSPAPVRVDESGTAEMRALAREFNTMMDVRAGHAAQLVHQASHDALTGLPNRFLLREQIDSALLGADNVRVCLLFLGLDRFKVVNDALGHEAGDRILCEVASRLSSVMQPGDTLARFGGDEFVLLLPQSTQEDATAVAIQLQQHLAEPFAGPAEDVVLRVSVGVAATTSAAVGSEQLLREAVAAMHHAKTSGQDVSVYDQTLQVRAAYQIQVERDLRLALERDELLVHYQPLTDISSGLVVGVEALVRWQHPDRGMVPPLEFIPVAELSGQINEIGLLVLNRACEQAMSWAAQGHHLRMSVNVAVNQLQDGDFPGAVAAVLARTGLPPSQLCLEITESSLMRSGGQMAQDLGRLRQLGVHLAIDDFGTGYSSLSYLHRLPVDEIKIDRSFISRLGGDPRVRHLVQAIIGMAQALDLTIVAEGVETAEQLEYLNDHGCDIAQGYLFSPPRPANRLVMHLGSRNEGSVISQG